VREAKVSLQINHEFSGLVPDLHRLTYFLIFDADYGEEVLR
jgi:hypothetical protein